MVPYISVGLLYDFVWAYLQCFSAGYISDPLACCWVSVLNLHYNVRKTGNSEPGRNAELQYVPMNILSLHF